MWKAKGSGANMGRANIGIDGGSWQWTKWRRKNSTVHL